MGIVGKGTAPNRAFAAALAESDLSHKRLARLVRDLSQRRGTPLYSDHVAVGRWLAGVQPRGEAARCIAGVLSDALRRSVTPAALGFTAAVADDQPTGPSFGSAVDYPADADTATAKLRAVAAADLDDAAPERLRPWDQHAAPSVISGYLFGGTTDAPTTTDGAPIDATAIRLTTARLMELDFQVGGGHTRELLLRYFRGQVLPLFDSLPISTPRRELFVATSA